MDYRMPGLDGVQATRAVREACPDAAVVVPHRVGEHPRDGRPARGRGRRLPVQEPGARPDRGRDPRRRGPHRVELTAANTAIVVDSTADFPEAPERFPNWRVVPLYVRFGDESYRDYVELEPHDFYVAAARRRADADDVAADARTTSPPSTRSSPGSSASTRCTSSGQALGHLRERACGRRARGRRTRPARRLGERVRGDRDARPRRSSGGSSAGRPTRRSRSSSRRYRRDAVLLFTVDTLEYLARGGRIGKAAAFAGQLLHIKPILTLADGEVEPLKRVRGNAKAFAEFVKRFREGSSDEPGAPRRDRARGCARARRGARGDGAPRAASGPDRAGDDARPRRRDARRPGNCRLLLVQRPRLVVTRRVFVSETSTWPEAPWCRPDRRSTVRRRWP